MAPGFADDGFLAGDSGEVLRALQHIKPLMPALGLRFGRLGAIPAAGQRSAIDETAYIHSGCTINKEQCVSIMKSPIGTIEFCEQEAGKRVEKAVKAMHAITSLPDQHCALNLLRYQTGRLDYTTRSTPSSCCPRALARFDVDLQTAYERIVGDAVSDAQWAQAVKPTRNSGLGMRSAPAVADAAYYTSRAAAWERCEAIWPGFARLMDDPVREAEARINARLPEATEHVEPLPVDGAVPRQQSVSLRLADADANRLRDETAPMDRARLIAYSAPMAGRWLEATPSKTLDKHMTSAELSITTAMHLGVDVLEGTDSCGFCGAAMDSKGIHPSSCMAGGDTTMRHNDVRNIIYRYARRGCLNAELEKAGVLDEPGVFVSLSRPADVMVDELVAGARGAERVALDIKVINALGAGHYTETLEGPLVAATAYRTKAIERLNTGARCAARGV
jgi:hypothetical protein